MAYEGRCHCGAVTLTVDGDIPGEAVVCNCSHCRAKGLVLTAVPRESITIQSGEDALTTYQFHRHVIVHRFCSYCGTQPFSEGTGPDGSAMAMINLRCVPEADLEAISEIPFDGASH